MKSTTNVFSKGLTTDISPIAVGKDQLTDALNATFITYNGNELTLQNDMGNTRIQDRITGSIMGLKEGFVPMAMKEHGGVLYIASYNPNTKSSELGSIPSPLFDYTYSDSNYRDCNKYLFKDYDIPNDVIILDIGDSLFYTGDGIDCYLNISTEDPEITKDARLVRHYYYNDGDSITEGSILYPLISNREETGLITLHALAVPTNSSVYVDLNQHVFTKNQISKQWFSASIGVPGNTIIYPNYQSGKLAVKPVLEMPSNIKVLQNASTNRNEPYYIEVFGNAVTVQYQTYNRTTSTGSSSVGVPILDNQGGECHIKVRQENEDAEVMYVSTLNETRLFSQKSLSISLSGTLGAPYSRKIQLDGIEQNQEDYMTFDFNDQRCHTLKIIDTTDQQTSNNQTGTGEIKDRPVRYWDVVERQTDLKRVDFIFDKILDL